MVKLFRADFRPSAPVWHVVCFVVAVVQDCEWIGAGAAAGAFLAGAGFALFVGEGEGEEGEERDEEGGEMHCLQLGWVDGCVVLR